MYIQYTVRYCLRRVAISYCPRSIHEILLRRRGVSIAHEVPFCTRKYTIKYPKKEKKKKARLFLLMSAPYYAATNETIKHAQLCSCKYVLYALPEK
jgi:hypothetical protein